MKLDSYKEDLRHFLVNSAIFLVPLPFIYAKFGFIGWWHVLTVFSIQYMVLPLDDWIEGNRTFPYYILPFFAFAFYHLPAITLLAVAGDYVTNLRAVLKKKNFWLERIETIGNVPIYLMPLMVPIGLGTPTTYLAGTLFFLFADSFHKIGHNESSNDKLMWWTGLGFLLAVVAIFGQPTWVFVGLFILMLLSLLPFKLMKKGKPLYYYTQGWFGLAAAIAFYYYLFWVI